jgi:spore maturation protein CgeB
MSRLPTTGHFMRLSHSHVTRAAMIEAGWSPSVRLFEAAACGTPIISDRWPGLSDLLSEREAILVADEIDDVVSALSSTPGTDRRAMADCARTVVLADHTGTARAHQLLDDVTAQSVSSHCTRSTPGRFARSRTRFVDQSG